MHLLEHDCDSITHIRTKSIITLQFILYNFKLSKHFGKRVICFYLVTTDESRFLFGTWQDLKIFTLSSFSFDDNEVSDVRDNYSSISS